MTVDRSRPGTPSAGKLVFLALGLVVGASSGAAVAWVVQTRARNAYESRMAAMGDEQQPASRLAHSDASAGGKELDKSDRADATTRSEANAAGTSQTDVFGDVQRAYGRVGIERGWAIERKDAISTEEMNAGLAQYEEIVRKSPDKIGRDLARRRTKTEDAERDAKSGGVLTLLEKLAEGDSGPVTAQVLDPKEFDKFFQRQTGESIRDGVPSRRNLDKDVENGVTFSFPAGVFDIGGLMQRRDPFPSDVTLAGVGMDATMLVLDQQLSTRGPLERFGIRNCTVFTKGHYLVDLSYRPASFLFDHVRFVGFSSGGLLSCAAHGFALRATSCRFEGGYAPAGWWCNLLDVRNDALIARFDGCTFDEIFIDIWRWHSGTTSVFTSCTFTNLLDKDPLTAQAASKPGVVFDGCTYSYFGPDPDSLPDKNVNDLFPDWQGRMRRGQ